MKDYEQIITLHEQSAKKATTQAATMAPPQTDPSNHASASDFETMVHHHSRIDDQFKLSSRSLMAQDEVKSENIDTGPTQSDKAFPKPSSFSGQPHIGSSPQAPEQPSHSNSALSVLNKAFDAHAEPLADDYENGEVLDPLKIHFKMQEEAQKAKKHK